MKRLDHENPCTAAAMPAAIGARLAGGNRKPGHSFSMSNLRHVTPHVFGPQSLRGDPSGSPLFILKGDGLPRPAPARRSLPGMPVRHATPETPGEPCQTSLSLNSTKPIAPARGQWCAASRKHRPRLACDRLCLSATQAARVSPDKRSLSTARSKSRTYPSRTSRSSLLVSIGATRRTRSISECISSAAILISHRPDGATRGDPLPILNIEARDLRQDVHRISPTDFPASESYRAKN